MRASVHWREDGEVRTPLAADPWLQTRVDLLNLLSGRIGGGGVCVSLSP